jgi:UDP-GlcNAc3NAcA epimerase
MKRILTIVGARPQIIKAAAISRAIQTQFADQLQEDILHTGQHYDDNMSDIFFRELGIPLPKYQLAAGGGSHGEQTAKMISGIESILLNERYDAVLVYGDTNSTLAGSIVASKLHIPVVHVEAGLRSFNKAMPEEINRIVCDHVSSLLFSPTMQGIENLKKENIVHHPDGYGPETPRVFHCGDIMYDNALHFSKQVVDRTLHWNITPGKFILCTIHRDHNTDDSAKLDQILHGLLTIARAFGQKIILPIHPRTQQKLSAKWIEQLKSESLIETVAPLSYLDMIFLESQCSAVITDSGGVQKEAFFFKKPCLIMRDQTEWVELVNNGNAMLCPTNAEEMFTRFSALSSYEKDMIWPSLFGNGDSASFICREIILILANAHSV